MGQIESPICLLGVPESGSTGVGGEINPGIMRRIERDLDLEESRIGG